MSTQRTLIVGGGLTGRSVLRHLQGSDELVLVDTRPARVAELAAEFPEQAVREVGSESALTELLMRPERGFDRAIISPGLPDTHPLLKALVQAELPLYSDLDLFCAAVTAPTVGCTGTNGKSTTTELIGALLRSQGLAVGVGGNLGPPALELLGRNLAGDSAPAFVLELSSFQLQRSAELPLTVALFLNCTPDHLDYHGSEAAYLAAKQRIYRGASVCVWNRDDPLTRPLSTRPDAAVLSFGFDQPQTPGVGLALDPAGTERVVLRTDGGLLDLLPVSELPLAGRHNLANLLAALAVVPALVPEPDLAALQLAVRQFVGLPHRCEPVGEVAGVRYVNDSKATNVAACVAAVRGLRSAVRGRLILLLGGQAKGADLTALAAGLDGVVDRVLVFGEDRARFADSVTAVCSTVSLATAAAAFAQASAEAVAGDLVLLAPAAASFDEFANFAARGDWFRERVAELGRDAC